MVRQFVTRMVNQEKVKTSIILCLAENSRAKVLHDYNEAN